MKYYYNYNNIFLEIEIEKNDIDFYIKKINFLKQPLNHNVLLNSNIKNFINKIEYYFENYFIYKKWIKPPTFKAEGTDFQKKVWNVLLKIPEGEAVSYSKLAEMCGFSKNYARAVGNACNQNPIPIIVPCHRVIGINKTLIGYAGGIEIKRWLLNHEGYQI